MTAPLQGSLFDQTDDLSLGPLDGLRRTELGSGAWIDLLPGWLSGADALFERLVDAVPWHAERRQMYDRVVDVPAAAELLRRGRPLPHPVLDEARGALDRPLRGRARRAVRHGRACASTATAATASPGTATDRPRQRPRTRWWRSSRSATARDLRCGRAAGGAVDAATPLGHGDLIVMGGSCQRTWEHAIPKTATAGRPADQHPVPPARRPLTSAGRSPDASPGPVAIRRGRRRPRAPAT